MLFEERSRSAGLHANLRFDYGLLYTQTSAHIVPMLFGSADHKENS